MITRCTMIMNSITSSNITNLVIMVITMYQQQCYLPAYEMAIAKANALYHERLNIQLVPMSRPDLTSCVAVAANVVDMSTAVYYNNTSAEQATIFISQSMTLFFPNIVLYYNLISQKVFCGELYRLRTHYA